MMKHTTAAALALGLMLMVFSVALFTVPGCAGMTTTQAIDQLDVVHNDIDDVKAVLDPTVDDSTIELLDAIDRGVVTIQRGLVAYGDGGEVKTVLDALDLVTAQLTAIYDEYADPEDQKARRVRNIVTAIRVVLRHVRASLET